MVNVIIQNAVHASTNPHKTVCGLPISKRGCYPTSLKINCPVCAEKEEARTKGIQAYINKLLEDDTLPLDQKMW